MKNKFRMLLFILVLVFGFTTNVNAEVKIKEDANDYVGDVYIIGSSRFDSSIIVTGTMSSVAGAREEYVQYVVKQNYNFKPEDVRIHYYSELADSWFVLPVDSEDNMRELSQEESKELVDNLEIYFVNEEEKVLEIPYDVNLEDGYKLEFSTNDVNHMGKVKYENGKIVLPATVKKVEIFATKENVEEGESSEKLYLGDVVQSEGTFENELSVVRTYEELKLALEEGISNIKLGENIEIPEGLLVNKEIVLDLNGKTLTASFDQPSTSLIKVIAGGKLTIEGNGTINSASQGNDYSIALWAYTDGEIIINNGTFTNLGAKDYDSNSLANNNELIYVYGNGKITINGGTFIGNSDNETYGARYTLNLYDQKREESSLLVKGGTFVGFNPADNLAEGENTNFVANGYKVVESNGEFSVVEVDDADVAVINGVAYQDLQEALDNANNGEVVVVVNDVSYEECDSTPLNYKSLNEDRTAILDLNGKTISAILNNGKSISLLEVGSVNADKNVGTATLTIEDSSSDMTGTMTITPTVESSSWSVAVQTISVSRLGRLTVNGGNIITVGGTSNVDNPYGILVITNTGAQTAELTINGGYIESKSSTGMGVRVAANSEKGPVKFTMNGGTIAAADDGRGIWLHHMAGSGKHQLIDCVINDGTISADRALEVGDFNKDTDVSDNIKVTINGGEFISTNNNNNPPHPSCPVLFTSSNVTYYNTTFTHVKVTCNK